MSLDSVRVFLAEHAHDLAVLRTDGSSATVALAAHAFGVAPERIAKTLALEVGDRTLLVVLSGTRRLDNRKMRATFGGKAKLLDADVTLRLTGHPVGGVCPFGLATPLPVYCDRSLAAFDEVVPAAGSVDSAVRLSPARLGALAQAVGSMSAKTRPDPWGVAALSPSCPSIVRVRAREIVMADVVVVDSSEGKQKPRLQRNARIVLACALVALGLWTLHGFLPALVWAAVIAVAIGPLYARAARRWPPGRHNITLPLLFTTAVAVVFLLPFVVLGVQAAREAHDTIQFARNAMESGVPVPTWISGLPFGAAQATAWWQANLADPSDVSGLVHHATHGTALLTTREIGAAFTHRVLIFCFTILTLFFVLRSGETLTRELLMASQKLFGSHGEKIARQIIASIHGTVDGLVLVGLVEGFLLGIVYAVTGVPHPTLLGALSAVAAMIPFLLVILLGMVGVFMMATGSALWTAIAVVAIGYFMVFVADHFVRPVLIGGATKLPFIWVLLGILGGVETWGLIGLFVGPAVMAALMSLWRDFVKPEIAPETAAAAPASPHRPKVLSPVPIASG